MKKLLLVSCLLSLVSFSARAVKLCGRTCTWSSGTISRSASCNSSGVCTCSASASASSCKISSSWNGGSYGPSPDCQGNCPEPRTVCNSDCRCNYPETPSGGTSTNVNPTSVSCPTWGTCADANFKTVNNDESCGDGYSERTTPALTITGEYSDDAGTFAYGECTNDP